MKIIQFKGILIFDRIGIIQGHKVKGEEIFFVINLISPSEAIRLSMFNGFSNFLKEVIWTLGMCRLSSIEFRIETYHPTIASEK
jgi:hypothetical protein